MVPKSVCGGGVLMQKMGRLINPFTNIIIYDIIKIVIF